MLALTTTEKSKSAIMTSYFAQRELKYPALERRLSRDPAKLLLLPYYKE